MRYGHVVMQLLAVMASLAGLRPCCGDAETFHVDTVAQPPGEAPMLKPWRTVALDPTYGGSWAVMGDVNGDGEVDVVSCRNVNGQSADGTSDAHYTSAAVAQKLDGSVLWRWGDPGVGGRGLSYDVALQIHDWDVAGRNEVVLCTKDWLVVLDGATGKEMRRLPLPSEATDCIVFANLSGGKRPTDLLVKTRYGRIWAYDRNWRLLWTVDHPGGYRTAHQPFPVDIDGDGRDEIMAGYALLNPDGLARWVLRSDKVVLSRGHLDCCRVLRAGARPEDFRLALTYCGANCIAVVDGAGKVLWEVTGQHYESVDVGKVRAGVAGLKIVVDVDHVPQGQSPTVLMDENGQVLGTFNNLYSRMHKLVDWNGDGLDEMVLAVPGGVFDGHGKQIARLSQRGGSLTIGDMTGDRIPDIALANGAQVYIYQNQSGVKPARSVPFGSGLNYTLY
jgi:hypothetical protein